MIVGRRSFYLLYRSKYVQQLLADRLRYESIQTILQYLFSVVGSGSPQVRVYIDYTRVHIQCSWSKRIALGTSLYRLYSSTYSVQLRIVYRFTYAFSLTEVASIFVDVNRRSPFVLSLLYHTLDYSMRSTYWRISCNSHIYTI